MLVGPTTIMNLLLTRLDDKTDITFNKINVSLQMNIYHITHSKIHCFLHNAISNMRLRGLRIKH